LKKCLEAFEDLQELEETWILLISLQIANSTDAPEQFLFVSLSSFPLVLIVREALFLTTETYHIQVSEYPDTSLEIQMNQW
jgi:hypothetical protein